MSEKDQLRSRVELIVRERLAQMNKDKAKSILVVLDGGMASINDFLNQLTSCRQEGCEVVIVASLLAAESYDLGSVKSYNLNVWTEFSIREGVIQQFLKNADVVLVPVLSVTIMAKLVLGISDTPISYLLEQALFKKKTVLAVDQDYPIGQSAYAHYLSQKAAEYRQSLQGIGLTLVPANQISNVIVGQKASVYFHRLAGQKTELLSQNWIRKLPQNIEVVICPRSTIITPLAREEAKKRNINIQLTEAESCEET
ncbi:hypothetical protein CMK13_10450 [Candidatus Poribacteria bacterium]|nr:hypothetical protein [Candidatus Poribacteria bacterium]OUT61004.1 MAG: hypothetical protein CBB75_09920 [bacterium TMED15]